MSRNNNRIPVEESLLTVREVAELDGCSEKSVRRAITLGLLASVRIGPAGHMIRITASAHRAYRFGRNRFPFESTNVQ